MASLGHPCKFQRLSRPCSVAARHSSSGRQPNYGALNRGRHLYLAGRPSRWALAHILVSSVSLLHYLAVQPSRLQGRSNKISCQLRRGRRCRLTGQQRAVFRGRPNVGTPRHMAFICSFVRCGQQQLRGIVGRPCGAYVQLRSRVPLSVVSGN